MHTNKIFHDIFQPFNADAQGLLANKCCFMFSLATYTDTPVYHHSFNLKQQLDELNPEMKKISFVQHFPAFLARISGVYKEKHISTTKNICETICTP